MLPEQNAVLFREEVTFAGIEKGLSADDSYHRDDFRLPVFHLLRHRFTGNPVTDNSISCIASDEMKNHQLAYRNIPSSPSFLYNRSALNYLLHIYPSHNFW